MNDFYFSINGKDPDVWIKEIEEKNGKQIAKTVKNMIIESYEESLKKEMNKKFPDKSKFGSAPLGWSFKE